MSFKADCLFCNFSVEFSINGLFTETKVHHVANSVLPCRAHRETTKTHATFSQTSSACLTHSSGAVIPEMRIPSPLPLPVRTLSGYSNHGDCGTFGGEGVGWGSYPESLWGWKGGGGIDLKVKWKGYRYTGTGKHMGKQGIER